VLDKLKRKKSIQFLMKSFPSANGKQNKDSLQFINTIAIWIDLYAGRDVVSTNDPSDTRFMIGEDIIYVDVTSVSLHFSNSN
jgi:hypothetical protein